MSGKVKNLIGKKFTRLSPVRLIRIIPNRGAEWECVCDCGKVVKVVSRDLSSNNTKSCGCWKNEKTRESTVTHGMSKSREYITYHTMLSRCNRPSNIGYALYGGRGIKVCAEWSGAGGFERFLSDMGPRPDGHSIERIDVNKDYEPSNCKWIPKEDQAKNTRSTVWYLADGDKMCQADAARHVGITSQSLSEKRLCGKPLPAGLNFVSMTT